MDAPEEGEIRRCRWEGPSGRRGEKQRAFAPPTRPGEPAEFPGRSPALQIPLQAAWILGGIGGRPGRSGEAGGRGPPRPQTRGAGKERRGLPCLLDPRKPAGLPGEVPCPLRPGVGGMPRPLLFLEPKTHTPTAPRALSRSVGPEHWPCPPPKRRLCLGPTLHSQGLSPIFSFYFPS